MEFTRAISCIRDRNTSTVLGDTGNRHKHQIDANTALEIYIYQNHLGKSRITHFFHSIDRHQ